MMVSEALLLNNYIRTGLAVQQNSDMNLMNSSRKQEKASSSDKSDRPLLQSFSSKLTSIGIDWIIDTILDSVTTALDNYINRVQYAQEALNEFYKMTSESENQLRHQSKWIHENSSKYARLAEGVDNYGHNVSLSADDFAEYQSITKDIADMFPSIIAGYNEQNDAIVKMKGNVDALTESYKENANEVYAKTLTNASEGFENYKTVINDATEKRTSLKQFIGADNIIAHYVKSKGAYDLKADGTYLSSFLNSLDSGTKEQLYEELENFHTYTVDGALGKKFKFSDLSADLQQKIKAALIVTESAIIAETQKVKPILESYVNSNGGNESGFSSLDEEGQQIIRNIIPKLDDTFYNQFKTDSEIASHFYTYYIEPLQDGLDNTDLAVRIHTLFSLNKNDYESYQEYVDAVSKIIDQLKGYKNKDGNPLFSEEQLNGLRNIMEIGSLDNSKSPTGQNLIRKVSEKYKSIEGAADFIKTLDKDQLNLIKNNKDNIKTLDDLKKTVNDYNTTQKKKEESQLPLSFSSSWNTLGKTGTDEPKKKEEKKRLLQLAKTGKLTTEEFEKSSIASQIKKDTGLSAESVTMKINQRVDDTGQLNSIKTGISAISSAYDEKKNKESKAVSISTLNSMYDTLGVSEWDPADQQVWENYKRIAGDGSKSIDELKDAQDELAQSYINSNNFLANLNDTNKDYYKTLLKQMGIKDAKPIVKKQLEINQQQAKEAKLESTLAPIDISNPTEEDIQGFKDEAEQLGFSNQELADFLIKKQQASETGLDDMHSINTLIEFCHRLGLTNDELEKLIRLKRAAAAPATKDSQGNSQDTTTGSQWGQKPQTSGSMKGTTTADMIRGAIATQENSKKKKKQQTAKNTELKIDDKKENSPKAKTPSGTTPKTKQEIDWISRKLTVLQSKIDQTKARFENLFSLSSKKNSLKTQIAQTTKLLKAQEKASTKYQKKADGIRLSKNSKTNKSLKTKVKKGDIKGSLSNLIHNYNDDTAKKITSYQNYIDKAKEARKATEELRSSLKDLNKQKLDLSLDNNETKRSYFDAKYSNATTVASKNKILDKEISTYRSDDKSYDKFYKDADKLRKSSGKTALSALSKSGLGSGFKKKIKSLIKKGREIPKGLLNKAKKSNPRLYNKLIDYNNNVDYVSDVLRKKNTSKEETKTSIREKETEKLQNHVDNYNSKAELEETLSTNAIGYKEQNSHLEKQLADLGQVYRYQRKIADLNHDSTEASRLQAEYEAKIAEIKVQEIENIQKEYENRIGQINNDEQDTQNRISLLEARGQTITADYYQKQTDFETQKRNEAVNERASVESALNDAVAKEEIKIYSDAWYEIQSSLQTLDNTINDCDIAIANNSAAIRELHTTMLDNMAENAARSNTEADFIATLLSHEELTDSKTGKLTDSGLGTLGTYGMRLNTSKEQTGNFKKERDILENMKKNGVLRLGDGSHDYDSLEQFEDAYKKIIDRQQEWVKNEFDAEQQIIDLMKSKYQAQLDYMKNIIDAKKNVLSMEKDLYDYQRNIADKTKNIAALEKQMSALQGDDSEEGRSRRSKLQASLDEANLDLQDTEYDRYITNQQNMLDSMSSQYEDLLNCLFKDTDALLQDGIDLIQDNSLIIQGILGKTAEDYSYNYSESFDKIIECLTRDGSPSANPPEGSSGAGQTPEGQQGASAGNQPADSAIFSSMQEQKNNAEQSMRNAEITQLKSFLGIHSGKGDTTKPLRPAKSGESFSSELNQKLSKYGYVVKSGSGSGGLKYIDMFAQELGNLSGDGSFKSNGKVYRSLSQKYPHIGFQTGGIIRADGIPKNGDNICVRVNPNETILTQDFTKLLPEAVGIMQRFTRPVSIPRYLQNMKYLPSDHSTSIGSINLSLDLPDIQNTQDFITELQNSKKIQRALEISISDCMKNGRITNNIQTIH